MADYPILFSPVMVRQNRRDLKTQTRRLLYSLRKGVTPNQISYLHGRNRKGQDVPTFPPAAPDPEHFYVLGNWHKVKLGDRLWARETFMVTDTGHVRYFADSEDNHRDVGNWRPSIHMPKTLSRLTMHINRVRVQELQAITDEDAIAEGVERVGARWEVPGICAMGSPREAYGALMDYLHGMGFWKSNPWLVAMSYDLEKCNIAEARK